MFPIVPLSHLFTILLVFIFFYANCYDAILIILWSSCIVTHFTCPVLMPHSLSTHTSLSASTFHCQHKGRSAWNAHPSCVACRIKENLFCSRDNLCNFCHTLDERAWSRQDSRVAKITRDWETGLKRVQASPNPSMLSTQGGYFSLSQLPEQYSHGMPTMVVCSTALSEPMTDPLLSIFVSL